MSVDTDSWCPNLMCQTWLGRYMMRSIIIFSHCEPMASGIGSERFGQLVSVPLIHTLCRYLSGSHAVSFLIGVFCISSMSSPYIHLKTKYCTPGRPIWCLVEGNAVPERQSG